MRMRKQAQIATIPETAKIRPARNSLPLCSNLPLNSSPKAKSNSPLRRIATLIKKAAFVVTQFI